MQDNYRSTMQQTTAEISGLRRRLDEMTIKYSSAMREIEYLSQIPKGIEYQPQPDYSATMQSLKESLNEEKRKRESLQKEYDNQIRELHLMIRNTYVEHGKRLQDYRDQIILSENETKAQLVGIEFSKDEKSKNDQEYLKAVYSNLQRRLENEVVQRNQLEKEYKA